MKQLIKVPLDMMVEHLNELLKCDPSSVAELVNHRVTTENMEFVNGEFPIIMAPVDDKRYRFGIIGVLNGMVVGGRIAAIYHDDELTQLSHFLAVYEGFENLLER